MKKEQKIESEVRSSFETNLCRNAGEPFRFPKIEIVDYNWELGISAGAEFRLNLQRLYERRTTAL